MEGFPVHRWRKNQLSSTDGSKSDFELTLKALSSANWSIVGNFWYAFPSG